MPRVDGSPQKKKGSRRETPFTELWRTVDKSVAGILDGANFSALVRNWTEKQTTYVQDWDIQDRVPGPVWNEIA
jgi:DNA-binding IscR family transcriptional regulator